MKKLHLICSNDTMSNPIVTSYIKFTFDRVFVTNGHVFAVLPTSEVLPGVLKEGEELFVHTNEWKNSKAYSAISFKRLDSEVICRDIKGNKTVFEFSKVSTYPDIMPVFPLQSEASLNVVSFDAELYATLLEGIGCKRAIMKFTGPNKPIQVLPYNVDEYGKMLDPMKDVLAMILPIAISVPVDDPVSV